MRAMVVKEFRQLLRDRRTLGLLVALPVVLLVVFGYAANFDVSNVRTAVAGPHAAEVAAQLHAPFDVTAVDPGGTRVTLEHQLRDGNAAVGVLAGRASTEVLMDGTQLFAVQAARAALARSAQAGAPPGAARPAATVRVLYNQSLKTSWIMIPGLTGLILLFIGTLITSLGIVRERQAGTIEQLAVMPFRPWDVIAGKILPYLLLASIDLIAIVAVGIGLFGVPFVGSVATFALGAVLFLLVALGMGVLISTVSQNQGQAIQLALMFVVPQILLSGLIFPVGAMAVGVQWIAHALPLTYFVEVSRGVMLKAEPLVALWIPIVVLLGMAIAVLGLAVLRFRRDLAPSARRGSIDGPQPSAAPR
ncbi:ABC transporter permease [Acidiferrimicrobium sp. IK]|uniref:ABC transporter permease n=1 Tax=Acidiferrimicrobium sp. IK TaxID=2871700 RepID=UPI0021CB59D7|nr:ABC transporter permease [Acidiferrimicrobium sp. IK]MCU4185255.1 ABC transporter permease [Acidiferrimicrobium sp. IK]